MPAGGPGRSELPGLSTPGDDRDGDGVAAARDRCQTLAEDLDGRRDGDGFPDPDVDDACAVEGPDRPP
ncbi:MAG: hypothetical protein CVU56_03320 [Deltaproteobacteria bacterium HGW-Deltaproteobacteria-14]|jgi:hypothetical protein|nr:MAG: hypothetical protein CVU56_03320 [Deltaproteobacteria bacterium HGW-Deltaproteobacteria-14]